MNWALALHWQVAGDASVFGHTWSLSTEEQFYLMWPVLLILMLRLKLPRKLIICILLAAIAIPTVLRFALWHDTDSSTRLYFAFDTHADGLLLGCLVGLFAAWNMLQRVLIRRMILGLCLPAVCYLCFVAIGLPFGREYPTSAVFLYKSGGFTLINFGIAAMLVYLVAFGARLPARILENRQLVWVGRISYGLYLWHIPVFAGLFSIGFIEGLFSLVFYDLPFYRFAMTFALAAASFYFVEKPFLRIKKRFTADTEPDRSEAQMIPRAATV